MANHNTSFGGANRLRRACSGTGIFAFCLLLVTVLAGVAVAANSKRTAVPSNTSVPTVDGNFQVKETVTATTGAWANNATAFTYQWQHCNSLGHACTDISGATDKTYVLVSDDVGHTMVVQVTAANTDGKATATSKPSPIVSDNAAPRNTVRPSITGAAQVGETLQVSKGTWTGGVRSYTYQWDKCDANGNNCVALSGATASRYGVLTADVGSTLRADVTAVNAAGSTTSNTDRSAVVVAGGSTGGSTCPTGGASTVAAADLNLPIRLVLDRFQFTPPLVTKTTVSFTGHFHVADTCGRSVSGAQLWSTAVPYNQTSEETGPTGADGWVTFTFKLNPAGFPANPGRQQILAMIVQVTKPGGNIVAGISTTRVVRENVAS